MTAPIKKRIVRFNRLEVNTGTDESPNYVVVKGLNENALAIEPNEVDVSDFDSEGWDDNLTTHRKWSATCNGTDGYTGPDNAQVDDPGQAFLKSKGVLTGPEAYATVRMYRTDNNKGFEGRVTVNWGGMGGALKDAEPFRCNLTGSGKLTAYTHTP